MVAQEFNELWVTGPGNARTVRRKPRQRDQPTTSSTIRFGVGVAVTSWSVAKARMVSKQHSSTMRQPTTMPRSPDKVDYVKNGSLTGLDFGEIKPDAKGNWLNQSNSNFERLIPLADRQTKLAKSADEERAIFALHSLGIATNRDEWTL